MAGYIVYLIDAGGRVRQGESLDCRNDAEAIDRLCSAEPTGEIAELWQSGRLVAKIGADGVLIRGAGGA